MRRSRSGAAALLLAVAAAGVIAGDEPRVCVDPEATNAKAFTAGALRVLRSSGHDPADYRLELRFDDPYVSDHERRKPETTATFLPVDAARNHALVVATDHPCEVRWLWRPAEFTHWQRRVIERAEQLSGIRWGGGRLLEVRVTETRERVGVEVFDVETGSPEFRVLLRKEDLGEAESAVAD